VNDAGFDAPCSPVDTAAEIPAPFAVLGASNGRLFAGPPRSVGPERFDSHASRLGPVRVEDLDPARLRQVIDDSRLLGRGGGEFPVSAKLKAAAASSGAPLIVANGSESEPASRKDRDLVELRPHLVLDGALVAARAAGASDIVLYLHSQSDPARGPEAAIRRALAERPAGELPVRLVVGPPRYVAGESSAIVSYLEGFGALPRRRRDPAAVSGVHGRPTVVSNVETLAHLALIARFGADWFTEAGQPKSPGSTLVTLAGEVPTSGEVVEVLEPMPIGDLLSSIGGLDDVPRAVLVGGYAGTWIDGSTAWSTPLDRAGLSAGGAPLGCGLVASLSEGSCGVSTTARLVRWMAGESAGQCGPCALGLPAVSQLLDAIAAGQATMSDLRRLGQLMPSLRNRGACGLPTGLVGLVESALDTFSDEVRRHIRGKSCGAATTGFPLSGINDASDRTEDATGMSAAQIAEARW
jgi:NADH:ubiquinone oxidoreductase subunit F (NADH-binding)